MDWEFSGIQLLADVLGWKVEDIRQLLDVKRFYHEVHIPKKNGNIRKIHVPHSELKNFQKVLLKTFLNRIKFSHGNVMHGFLRKHSYVTNAQVHLGMSFVARIDLKDAFPSVKREVICVQLQSVIRRELDFYSGYNSDKSPRHALFPWKNTKWFRKLCKSHDSLAFPERNRIIDEFVNLVSELTTLDSVLPQGAPTSPFLLNLVLAPVARLVQDFLRYWNPKTRFTVYADDFTISHNSPIPRSLLDKVTRLIEENSDFVINQKKTLYFRSKRIAPMVTGIRLRTIRLSGDKFPSYSLGLSKKQIRKIRGLIHCAVANPELRSKVEGFIANIRGIYGEILPHQISNPYNKYLRIIGIKKG